MNAVSGARSRTRCRNGAKSGWASGTCSSSITCPPPAEKALTNAVSASVPGAQSFTIETTFLLPFLAAQSPMIIEDWPSVKLVRVMKGERSIVTDAPEMITTVGILACVTSWPMASAVGVMPPSTMLTLSLTIISCTTRRAASGTPESSRTISSIFFGDKVAVELHVELGAGERLAGDGLEAAGQRQARADLDHRSEE